MPAILKILRWVPLFAFLVACVDPIRIDVNVPGSILIVEGLITSDDTPYVVKVSHAFAVSRDSSNKAPVSGATIVLHSTDGESENLVEQKAGVYETLGQMQGVIGKAYYITLTMPDGSMFESEPDSLFQTGEISAINYAFEHRTTQKSYGVLDADVFNVYVDAGAGDAIVDKLSYMRWRFTGTYRVDTNPELHTTILQGVEYKTPWPCSGYVVDPGLGGGVLRQDTVCTCCTCYAQQFEDTPHLSDSELVSNGEFRNVKVAEVPITRTTFIEKYYVHIEQMAISKNAFDFFKITRAQKENTTNLFQPPPGQHVGNVKAINNDQEVVGLFWASSVSRAAIFIPRSAVPYNPVKDIIPFPCTTFAHSSTTRPDFWDQQ